MPNRFELAVIEAAHALSVPSYEIHRRVDEKMEERLFGGPGVHSLDEQGLMGLLEEVKAELTAEKSA
jgi:hypothetical protein